MLIAALLLFQAAPAPAARGCAAIDTGLPPELSGWKTTGGQFTPGKAVQIATADASALRGLPPGHKPGRAVALIFSVIAAGRYGVALDQSGWIDMVPTAGGEPLRSVEHGHGPECSTVRKLVRFQLVPGRYRVVLTGLAKPSVKVMLVAP